LKVFNDYKRRNQGNVGGINGIRLFFRKVEMDFRQEMGLGHYFIKIYLKGCK